MSDSTALAADPAPASRSPLRRHPWWTGLGLAAVALLGLVVLWDWNWFKGPLERQVQARTGRSFEIAGSLDVDLGRITTIRATALRLGNAPWSQAPTMASAQRLEFGIETWPLLLRRQVRIPDMRLGQPRLRLETGPKGVGNWMFGKQGGRQPQFRRLRIDDGQLRFIDAPAGTDIRVAVASAALAGPAAAPPIDVAGGGRWRGNRFRIRGRAESPLDLRDSQRPYRIDARAQAGATQAHARGTLLDPLRLRDFDLKLALSGKDLADLYPLIGIATPPTPPYALDGRLRRDASNARVIWLYQDFSGRFGDSDLSGNASVTRGGARPYLRADLVSRRLDFDDLAGFVGAAPGAGAKETTNAELAALAARQQARSRVLPDTPYALDRLRAMDADVRWKAQRLQAPRLPLDDMDARLLLENGLLQLKPLNFGVAGGDIRANIRMDACEKIIRTRADIAARGLNLARLLPDTARAQDAIGKLGGNLALSGRGNSIAQMLGSSDGTAALGMGRGQVSNLLMEYAGIDIAEALRFLIRGDRKIPIRCAFGDFSVKGGVMTARTLAFDTSDTIIVGAGSISLKDETLALKLRPRPKDRTLFALRAPLILGGTFKDPSFRPDYARIGLRGAIALTLASIAPPAALLATIDLGGGQDSTCGGRYAK